jgi:hypothetical protein
MEEFIIEEAIAVVNRNGYYFKREVLNNLNPGDIIRISYLFPNIDEDEDNMYNSDSPYVKILKFEYEEFLGEIIDPYDRMCGKEPVPAGERVWFKKNNIFEINTELLDEDRRDHLESFLKEDMSHVPITGVLLLLSIED